MRRATIAIPGIHDLNIAPITNIVDSRPFQRLRERKQLGMSHLVFPGAQHTRFEHALGVYSLTCERVRLWVQDGVITEEQGWNLCLFGLLHDIGHGPYSHAVESLCPTDHNDHGRGVLQSLSETINRCNGNSFEVLQLFTRQNPLSACVSHRATGTDKMDYLRRDALYTTDAVAFRTGDMLNHVHYIDGHMAIDGKFASELMQLEREYVDMHIRVYFRSPALITQCFLRQIVARALAQEDFTAQALQEMTDSELDEALRRSKHPDVPRMFTNLVEHNWPRTALKIAPVGANVIHSPSGKPKHFSTLSPKRLNFFTSLTAQQIAIHEEKIAKIANVPEGSVLIVPITTPERFIPERIGLCDEDKIVGNLQEFRPAHYASLHETLLASTAVRICVPKEHRERVASESVAGEILEYIKSIPLA